MKTIPLSQGLVALVDDEDFDFVSAGPKWHAHVHKGKAYARRNLPREGGNQRTQLMHRLLLPNTIEVDHINGDGLDNRRENLRAADRQTNTANRRRNVNNTSGFKGVGWHQHVGKWTARIRVGGRQQHLGYFATRESAARSYDRAARAAFGEFAALNFPMDGEVSA